MPDDNGEKLETETDTDTTLDLNKFVTEYFHSTEKPRLEIGAGRSKKPGWLATDLNGYLDPNGAHVLAMDATKTFPFNSSIFSYIFSEHMIEHIPLIQGRWMLQECLRVLRPGGIVRIATPPIGMILKVMSPDRSPLESAYFHWLQRTFWPNEPLQTTAVFLNHYLREWGHQFVYDRQTFIALMQLVGFQNIRECLISQSEESELQNLEKINRVPPGFLEFETMVFEAQKPILGYS